MSWRTGLCQNSLRVASSVVLIFEGFHDDEEYLLRSGSDSAVQGSHALFTGSAL
jgi:hypothetical protein